MRLRLRDIYNKVKTGIKCGTAEYYEAAQIHDFLYIVQIEKITDCISTDCLYLLSEMSDTDSELPVKESHLLIMNSVVGEKGDFQDFAMRNRSDVLVITCNQNHTGEEKSIILHYIAMNQELNYFSDKMFSLLYEEHSMNHIVDEACDILGNYIQIFDAGFDLLATGSNMERLDATTHRIIHDRHLMEEDFVNIRNMGIDYGQFRKTLTPLFLKEYAGNPERLVINISNSKDMGFIVLIATQQPIREIDYELLPLLRNVIAIKLRNESFVRNSKGMNYEYFMMDLLTGRLTAESKTEKRFSFLTCSFSSHLYCVVIEIYNKMPYLMNVKQLRDALEKMIPEIRLVYNIDTDQMVGVISLPENKIVDREMFQQLHDFCRENNLYAGISNRFSDIFELLDYYRQAMQAMNCEESYSPGLSAYYKNAVRHMSRLFLQHECFEHFCHPHIRLLLDYDQLNHTRLTETLYVYLVNDRNITLSAQNLEVHKNTLIYRLSRIGELVQIEFENAENRLYLILSYRLYMMRNSDFVPVLE